MYKHEELNVLANRFQASCQYVDTCAEFVMDNYQDLSMWNEVKKNLNDIYAQVSVMREITDETKKLAMNNPENDLMLKESTSLMMSMISTIGYISQHLKELSDTVKFTPKIISESQIRHMKMDWRKEK